MTKDGRGNLQRLERRPLGYHHEVELAHVNVALARELGRPRNEPLLRDRLDQTSLKPMGGWRRFMYSNTHDGAPAIVGGSSLALYG